MINKLLLPYVARIYGLLLFLPGLILGFANMFLEYEAPFLQATKFFEWLMPNHDIFEGNQNFTDEIALSLCIIGLLLIAFSREKQEDEFIQKIRVESFQWAVLVHYCLLLLVTWLIYESAYFYAMVANMLTVLIIFNIRFHWMIRRFSNNDIR